MPYTVYFLGAGFSIAATNGEAPAMAGFFRGLKRDQFPILHDYLLGTFHSVDRAELQEVICDLDQACDMPLKRLVPAFDLVQIEIELADYTLGRLVNLEWCTNNWAVNLLANAACSDASVITANYDTIAEQVLSSVEHVKHCGSDATCPHCRMLNFFDICQSCDVSSLAGEMWRNNILKLHGSIAWSTCRSEKCVAREHTWASCNGSTKNVCPRCRCKAVSVLMQPRMKKLYSQHQILTSVWDAAQIALRSAERLVLFGFSIPTTDAAIRRLFRESLSYGKLRQVITISREPMEIWERLSILLPNPRDIEHIELAAPRHGEWPSWFEKHFEEKQFVFPDAA